MNNIIQLRKELMKKEFSKMNNMQQEAIFCTQGPLLVLAGAGSGKTTVLVNRIANILEYGNAYHSEIAPELCDSEINELKAMINGDAAITDEMRNKLAVNPAKPWQILAITFTNKAAKELVERIEARTGEKGAGIWAATFHSTCARILRRFADRIGYESTFTVYDSLDQRRLIKDCMKELNIDEKLLSYKTIVNEISRAKDKMITPEEYKNQAGYDNRKITVAKAYAMYCDRLKKANAMDFDDLLLKTVELFIKCPDVLELYQRQFEYIMVDEYQDTNCIQYKFVSMLAKSNNICVVGDDDQSIYKFRGATIENILSFEKTFKNAKVIRLEQNYRSTKTILNAANKVIENNTSRKGKTLWTENAEGDKITVYTTTSEHEEARYITDEIIEGKRQGRKFSDFAILYRMNAQSNVIEQSFARSGIPHRVIGGHRFYDREEIKDMTSYLQFICNPADNNRLKRIINKPRRGIGEASLNEAEKIALGLGETLYEVLKHADEFPTLSRARKKIAEFCELADSLIEFANNEENTISDLYDLLLDSTDYREYLLNEHTDAENRIENIEELKSNIIHYEDEAADEASLQGFLEEISLITDIDNYNADSDSVVMMTLHSAKGLEFPVVFIPGMEDGIFPGTQNLFNEADMEEERRLAYVGITRAKEKLYMTKTQSRTMFGNTQRNKQSVFLSEIPVEYKKEINDSKINPAVKNIIFSQKLPDKPFIKHTSVSVGMGGASGVGMSFSVGDRVSHKAFGEGMITKITPMGKDHLLEIAFDTIGTKKLMASFANLKLL
ncbi:MAG: UvrD-helicase domain-containing protein [Clostridiales bacterium]|nr:UvrD-helicase domain-containing protein [Clostridiales bacterium]